MKFGKAELLTNAAENLRSQIAEWFGAEDSNRVILAPGILIGLRLLLEPLNIRKLLLTSDEYYNSQHFPSIKAQCYAPQDILDAVQREDPSALLMSVVTWRGQPLNVQGMFRRIAQARAGAHPLLIADYAHAGAIGFPKI